MDRLGTILDRLADSPCCGYRRGGAAFAEPTALAVMALAQHGRPDDAASGLQWLGHQQARDGSVGVSASERTPCWPTGLAVLAWCAAAGDATAESSKASLEPWIRRGLNWILESAGEALPRLAAGGHDTSLVGWSWVDGTHSWVEPTAIQVLALKATGFAAHPRTRQGVKLLVDRLLPGGGVNFGNVAVFGHELRPQVMPTGLALLALAGEPDTSDRLERSLRYLERTLSARTTTASLCYGLMGLAAHGRLPAESEAWLKAAAERTLRERAPFKMALLALAAGGDAAFRVRWTGGKSV